MSARQEPRRARDLGIVVGTLPTARHNALTDVPGVHVGHTTVLSGDDIRTGVTAVVPRQLATRRALPAGFHVGNGYGKFIGSTQVVELGELETPVVLTATLSAFRAADALLGYVLGLPGRERTRSVNPVVGETNDGVLSDIRARPVTERHVLDALHGATSGPVAEGAVGAGTGTVALGFKAGVGTASRTVDGATVGVLVQANFSGVLRVTGVPVPAPVVLPAGAEAGGAVTDEPGGSCVVVVATDACLDARQLTRIARRAVVALAVVGSDFSGTSGDYALAFSTAEPGGTVPDAELDGLFRGVLEAVEEAVLNSLFMAVTMTGFRGAVRHAVPHRAVLELLRRQGAG